MNGPGLCPVYDGPAGDSFKTGVRMRFNPIYMFAIAFATPLILHQSLFGQTPNRDGNLAVIDDSRAITQREVDEMLGHKLYLLQKQIYEMRRNALNALITKSILTIEARRRGMPVEAFKRSLFPATLDIPSDRIEDAYREYGDALGALDESEVKERIRLDLETNAKMSHYIEAVEELKKNTKLEIYLDEPELPVLMVDQDGPRRGGKDAQVTIVVFSDFQCHFCRKAAATMDELLRTYGDRIALVYKHSPSPGHPRALAAARASVCAGEQGKFWDFHDRVFASDDLSDSGLESIASSAGIDREQFRLCLRSPHSAEVVERDRQEARRIGLRGTPYFVINGRSLPGAVEIQTFRKIIDREMEK